MCQNHGIFPFVLRGLTLQHMNYGNLYQLPTLLGHKETSKKMVRTLETFSVSTHDAFKVAGFAIP